MEVWGAFFAGVIAIIIAIWGKGLASIFFHPNLELYFDNNSSDVSKLPTDYNRKDRDKPIRLDAYYFRFRVKNIGNVTAKDVEVYVNQLLEEQADGKYKLQNSFIPFNLIWSHINSVYFRQIPPDMERHCDLGNIAHPDLRRHIPEYAQDINTNADITLFSIAYKVKTNLIPTHRLLPNKYKLQLLITASNITKPKSYYFIIEHNGKWFEDKDDMVKKGTCIEINSA